MSIPDRPKQTKQNIIATAERRLHKLDRDITEAIGSVLAQKGWSRQELARRTGLPHSTLSTIMSESSNSRSWNLGHLMRIAVALGVKLSDIILAAEQQDYTAIVLIAVSGTEPQSKARLTKIIQCAAPEGASPEMMAMFYNSDMMEAVAPGYVSDYLSGKIGDPNVYETLSEVVSGLGEGENFWVKFAGTLLDSGNSLTS